MNDVICDKEETTSSIETLFMTMKNESKLLTRILIANNGLSAAKFIKSMVDFSYQACGENVFEFYGMTTLEDLDGGYEYCTRLTDFEIVKSGPSETNFGNIELIVRVATQFQCGCVWAGWGHASEDPELPAALEKTSMVFLGPSSQSMWLLGNKISSVIVADKLGISMLPYCIDDGVRSMYLEVCNSIFTQKIDLSSIGKLSTHDTYLSDLKDKCRTLNFPVLLKMSHTGGGRGIRKIESAEELDYVIDGYRRGPFLVVECVDGVRHIEVQVVSDRYSNVLILGERDCTTQRRHQKVIETSVSGIRSSVIQSMERDAEKLVREARYVGLATVEFLFDAKSHKYYFLEVNTRIQVEHTVTEVLFDINLPAIQYMVGMGVSIEDIRKAFDISTPKKYVMGVRLTAENPSSGFDPVTGKISVKYEPAPGETGYFSVHDGAIHEYSESQFGHIFVYADTRKACIAKCLRALSSVQVEYIETPIKLISRFIQTPEFVNNEISTSSLEAFARSGEPALRKPVGVIHESVRPYGTYGDPSILIDKHQGTAKVVAGSIATTYINFINTGVDIACRNKAENSARVSYNTSVSPSREELKMAPHMVSAAVIALDTMDCILEKKQARISFLLGDMIYVFEAHLASPSHIVLEAGAGISCISFRRVSPSKVVFKQGSSHIVKFFRVDTAYFVVYDGNTYLPLTKFSSNGVLSPKSGKLVTICKKNGDFVLKNDIVFEMESLKIRSAVHAPFDGIIAFEKRAGDRVASQELICTIENASNTFKVFSGIFGTFVDDGTLTLHALEGFSVPSRIWYVPEQAEDIDIFISTFLRNRGNMALCYEVLVTLKRLLSKGSIGFIIGNKLIRSLHHLVLTSDDATPSLYSCIEFCVDALENSVHNEYLGLRPYMVDMSTESPIRIHYMNRSASRMWMDTETSSFIPRRSLFMHFSEESMCAETHASVYLSEDFWPTLLSNVRLKVLRGKVVLDSSKGCVWRSYTKLIINLHSDKGAPVDELPSFVFGHLNTCKIENMMLCYQDKGMQYEVSNIRGFLETKLVKNDTLLWYRLNLRPIRGVSMQDVMFDKTAFVGERMLAKKNNTIYYRDFIEIVKMYFRNLAVDCKVSEVYMCDFRDAEVPSEDGQSIENSERKTVDCNLEDKGAYPLYVYGRRRYTLSQHVNSSAAIGIKGFVLEYNKGKVVMIFNDISHKHGSFSILEDVFFYLLTKYCRINKCPRVFVASNSGARVGVCNELIKDVEAVVKDGKIEYLAVKENAGFREECPTRYPDTQKEWGELSSAAVQETDKALVEIVDGRKRILSIFGNTDSGPENLSFSALIAAETARAYRETLTISYVTGMSVGIGAYLVRLGDRIIQKQGAPILLTGYKVLNRLLQKDIYSSNAQIGGFDVLGHNGVSHIEVYDDLHGIEEIFWWVDFYFSSRVMRYGSSQVAMAENGEGIHGKHGDDDFDGSFNEREVLERVLDNRTLKEYQRHWAPNVVVGRGYINGVALGIICPEIESKVTTVPCEPSETSTSITWTKNVIFCETAEKIAKAIENFNNEKVDLLIIANWKGFSGSTTSMFKGIMKTGADIIKNLANFQQKIIIYLSPHGELRGGTYVVFDKKINPNIHIIAHPTAEVGIIQPDGLGEIKMRNVEDKAFSEAFCKLHDNVYRMVRNGIIDGLVKTQSLKMYIMSYLGLN